jgi:hypothetical protein
MAKANVKLYFQENIVSETTIRSNLPKEFDESLIDTWTEFFRKNTLTLKSLKVTAWDVIEFEVDGTKYIRNYS